MNGSKRMAAAATSRRARVIKVAPVTRAIRAALAVSATAFALSASATAYAGTCAHAAPLALRCDAATQALAFQPPVDLTTVHDASVPSSVVSRFGGALTDGAALAGGVADASFAPADTQSFGDVQDLTAVAALAGARPGGVSGSDDAVAWYNNVSGTNGFINPGVPLSASSATGIADAVFFASDNVFLGENHGALSASGYTWAAGIEVEADGYAHDIHNSSDGTISATASGAFGQAWGIYAAAPDEAGIYNEGLIDVASTGYAGTAVGLFAQALNGDAHADNSNTINASADGAFGLAFGISVVADAAADASNSGSIVAIGNGYFAAAYGMAAYSAGGDASLDNTGSIDASAYGNAIGMSVSAPAGTASASNSNSGHIDAHSTTTFADGIFAKGAVVDVDNTGTISAVGNTWAAGIEADGGQITVSNDGTITAISNGQAFGIIAESADGDASVTNTGLSAAIGTFAYGIAAVTHGAGNAGVTNGAYATAYAYSANGVAVGIDGFADLGDVTIDNAGQALAYAGGTAVGIFAYAPAGTANVDNSGSVTASAYGPADGILAIGNSVDVANSGTVDAYSYAGAAIGIYGYAAGDVGIDNSGSVTAVSYNNLADGIFASGADVVVSNTGAGDIYAYGVGWSAGIEAQGANSTHVDNAGNIEANAWYGNVFGVYATGGAGGVSIDNSGTITVGGYGDHSIGIDAIGGGAVRVDNSGAIHAGGLYSSYDATGIHAANNYDGGSAVVDNSDVISADSFFGSTGIEVVSTGAGGTASVINTGAIYATQASKYGSSAGIVASGDGDATINNAGLVIVQQGQYDAGSGSYLGGNAYGLAALSFNGDASVVNTGLVQVVSPGSYSTFGVLAASQNGAAQVDNQGVVYAVGYLGYGVLATTTSGDISLHNGADALVITYGLGLAAGMGGISSQGDIDVENQGGVATMGIDTAVGLFGLSGDGNVSVENCECGSVDATSKYGNATGILARSDYGTASVLNAGDITVTALMGGNASGIRAGGASVQVTSTGDILAQSYAANATGVLAYGGAAQVDSSGDIVAVGYGAGRGITVYADAGDAGIDNSGTVRAYGNGLAIGAYAYSASGNASIDNSGLVVAHARYGAALGLIASAGGDVDVANTGEIDAAGASVAIGVYAYAGDVATVHNDGSIAVNAYSDAYGMYVLGAGGVAIDNAGSIRVNGDYAVGIYAASAGDISVDSDGDITVQGTAATGIAAQGNSDITVANGGTITVGGTYATGLFAASGTDGATVAVTNGGTVTSHGANGAAGIVVLAGGDGSLGSVDNSGNVYATQDSKYGSVGGLIVVSGGNAGVDNSGLVSVSGGSRAYGVLARGDDGANVANAGDIEVTSDLGHGIGIRAASVYGDVTVDNAGALTTHAKYAYGVLATAEAGDVTIHSGGDADVHAFGTLRTYGLVGYATTGNVGIDNAGVVYASGLQDAFGIYGGAGEGDVLIANDGELTAASGFGGGFGIYASAGNGTATVDNSGAIHAYSIARGALGIVAAGDGVDIGNSGSITVHAYSEYGGPPSQYGPGFGPAIGILADGSAVDVGNTGSIGAYAIGDALGIVAGGDSVHVGNGGAIAANAVYGDAVGIAAYGTDVTVDGSGSILVSTAHGEQVEGIRAIGDTVAVVNTGSITAASPEAAYVHGIAVDGRVVQVDNGGAISAQGTAVAVALFAMGADAVSVGNAGTLAANVAGDVDSLAVGASVFSDGTATLTNSGSISAVSAGDGAAIGVLVQANGLVTVNNTGTITATQADYAVAVALNSATGAVLTNHGTLRTDAALEGRVAVQGGAGVEHVVNDGHIFGALVLNDGDDLLVNAGGGTWTVQNHATDFGAGDDAIVNGGTIDLANAAIHLGASATDGNSFHNLGTILVAGDSSIDMGTGPASALAASANPLPFANDGVIDFVDGAPDDTLTIDGDLGGNGSINIDVSLPSATSDMLYVNGDVVDGSTQTVNVDIGGARLGADSPLIAFAKVSGESSADAFVGGHVIGYEPGNFLDLRVNVTSDLKAAGADVFSIGVVAAGLDDGGALAASIAPGVQSLVNAQVGTWRQRMGVVPAQAGAGPAPWARYFADSGDVDPDHGSNFGNGGNFGFEQSNHGWELGLDARPADHLAVGVLVAKSEGTQHLGGEGAGADRFDGRSFGVYGTWLADNGFYVDASMRWTGIDARLHSAAGNHDAEASADTFNVEAGFTAWTVAGLNVVPQLQYTYTRVGDITTLRGSQADFVDDGGTSSRGRLGVGVDKTLVGDSGWTWTPYGALSAVHEFDGEYGYSVNDVFTGSTSTGGTSALLELGLGARKDRFSVTGGVNWTDGGAVQSVVGGQLVLRYNW